MASLDNVGVANVVWTVRVHGNKAVFVVDEVVNKVWVVRVVCLGFV